MELKKPSIKGIAKVPKELDTDKIFNSIIHFTLKSYKKMYKNKNYINSIKKVVNYSKKPIEDILRNHLYDCMMLINREEELNYFISKEDPTTSDYSNETNGFIDIAIYLSYYKKKCFSLECKRISKDKSIKSSYINKGIKRYIDLKYVESMKVAGMIGFVEEGQYSQFSNKVANKIKETVNKKENCFSDVSEHYKHNYVYYSKHKRVNQKNIKIYHMLFDFVDLSSMIH